MPGGARAVRWRGERVRAAMLRHAMLLAAVY